MATDILICDCQSNSQESTDLIACYCHLIHVGTQVAKYCLYS